MKRNLDELAERGMVAMRVRNQSIVTAESCTAGRLATLLSNAPGASEHLHGGFITYTKANKTKALGVPENLLAEKGAVCRDVAIALALGALQRSPAEIAVSITGVAGPDLDEDGNPVGFVCIAVARRDGPIAYVEKSYGAIGREAVQDRAMADALTEVISTIQQK
jgi:nicotinamide-nucleotide amidase